MTRWLLLLVLMWAANPVTAAATRITLPNGCRVIVAPHSSTEVVAIELLLGISAADERPDQIGLRYLTQRLLLRGTTAESGEAIAHRLAAVGGVAEATIGLDYVELYALVPVDGFETALDIIAQAVQNPALDPAEVERQRAEAIAVAQAAAEDGFQATYLALREALYPWHPYGALTYGSPATLASLTPEDVMAFHAAQYLPNRAVLAVVGGIGAGRALKAVKAAFGDWAVSLPPATVLPVPPRLSQPDLVVRERKVKQLHVMLGFPAPAASEEDYYAGQVLDAILGGGISGRLQQRLRDELGLVYQASTFPPTLAGRSHFVLYAVSEPEQLATVQEAMLELVRQLQEKPVSAEELARAKSYLLGSYALSHQRMKDRAYALAWYETLGIGMDFEDRYRAEIAAVTSKRLQEAAQTIFGPSVLAVTYPEG